MSRYYDMIIVGAGMVGAAAACAFAQRGRRIALIESTTPQEHSSEADYDIRVSAISPGSRELLRQLGIWQRLDVNRVCSYEQMHIWHENGAASLSFDAVDLARDDLGVIVENRQLLHALHQACSQQDGIDWYRPERVEQILENHADGVVVRLESNGILQADWVIAADGRGSPTRTLAGLTAEFDDYAQTAFVANVDTTKSHAHTAWQRFLATGPLAFLPLANGQSSIVWSCDDDFAEQVAAADDETFCAMLGEAFEFRLGQVTDCGPRASFRLGWHVCEHWFEQRVLLIGDAAHSVHPLAGQGVNLGFSDVELLLALGDQGEGNLTSQSLRRYERQRRSETWLASQSLGGLKWVYGLEQKPLTSLRDLGMKIVDQTPWLKRELMRKAVQNLT